MHPNQTNGEDFPIRGFLAWLVLKIAPSRQSGISDENTHERPGNGFHDLLRSLLKNKVLLSILLKGTFAESLLYIISATLPMVIGHFAALLIETDPYASNAIVKLIGLTTLLLLTAMTINLFGARNVLTASAISEAQTRRHLTWWALGHSAGWFASREAGQIAHRIADVSRQMGILTLMLSFEVLDVIVSLIAVFIIMCGIYPYAGLFFAVWGVIFFLYSLWSGLLSQKFMRRTVKRRAAASGLVTDSIVNHALVSLFNAKTVESAKIADRSQDCFETYIEGSAWTCIKNFLRDIWITFMVIAMISILGYAFKERQISAASFIGGLSVLFVLISKVRSFHHVITDILESIATVQEGLSVIAVDHDIVSRQDQKEKKLTDKSVRFEHVTFSYNHGNDVLEDIDLHIPQGQKLGIVGPSGAGKTTLMALLLRFWDTESGAIKIGGESIKDIPSSLLRENMALIPQDTSLFHRSLAENIRYGCPAATEKQVIAAAKKAYAHDFISQLPEGYNTLVGERGVKLSGGQRQRIAIARAVLKDAPILILDEATSSLDSESERLIQKSLEELMAGKTVIAVAHRLSTIAHLDRLVVMDQGRIVEDGKHESLLQEDGLYKKLWDMQSGGFLGE